MNIMSTYQLSARQGADRVVGGGTRAGVAPLGRGAYPPGCEPRPCQLLPWW